MINKKHSDSKNDVAEILTKLLIVQLAVAGIPQSQIRSIVGGDIVRVNQIARFLKKSKKVE